MRRSGGAALALLLACAAGNALAQAPAVTNLQIYTENRGWNQAGLGPVHQVIVNATVVPSGMPTLVFAEKDGVREPMTHFPQPGYPDTYALWKRVDPGAAGAWRVVAERGEAKSAPVDTRVLTKPRTIPLIDEVRVSGKGTQPRVSWQLPSLKSVDVDRIRVGVRGGERVHGRFMSLLRVSDPLPPDTKTFKIPQGWLEKGQRYVFQVMLEDLEGGMLQNRSLSFSNPYSPER